MSRMLTFSIVFCLWSMFAGGFSSETFAQSPPRTPPARQPRPQGGAELQVQNLPPALERLLNIWSIESAKFTSLHGTHQRFVYDKVFMTEKRSVGMFYYEAPSKGRIDIQPVKVEPGSKHEHIDPDTKKKFVYTLKQDRPERWICNGEQIWQVNDDAKQVEVVSIPQEHQGQNIMDGPLPFLFGMPPDKAKRRYKMAFSKDPNPRFTAPRYVQLDVWPLLRADAANWKKAEVILDTEQYLPFAVRLIDPTGNTETTYIFGNMKVNPDKPGLISTVFGAEKDPFNPDLKKKGYTFKVHSFPNEKELAAKPGLPSVVNLPWKDAQTRLQQLGYKVKLYTGKAADNPKLVGVVCDQIPAGQSPVPPGQEVVLTVYNINQPTQPPQPGQVPVVLGLVWKDAGKILEQAGYKVKYLPGLVPPSEDMLYIVYNQTPNQGQPLQPGGEVTLTVYNKPK